MSNSKLGLVSTLDSSGTTKQMVQALKDAIPDPDSTSTSGAISGTAYYDQMQPSVAAQLHVDLAAILAKIG